jgi:hypothetical protein
MKSIKGQFRQGDVLVEFSPNLKIRALFFSRAAQYR